MRSNLFSLDENKSLNGVEFVKKLVSFNVVRAVDPWKKELLVVSDVKCSLVINSVVKDSVRVLEYDIEVKREKVVKLISEFDW